MTKPTISIKTITAKITSRTKDDLKVMLKTLRAMKFKKSLSFQPKIKLKIVLEC